MMKLKLILFVTLTIVLTQSWSIPKIESQDVPRIYPVAVFHGLGDACHNAGMKSFVNQLKEGLGGETYVACIESGGTGLTFVNSMNEQAERACEQLNKDPNFRGNISVIGLSQGGLMARSIIESCVFNGQVKRYIGVSTPQMGVASLPNCFKGLLCNYITKTINGIVYNPTYQNVIGPAEYWNNPKDQEAYLKGNLYLPELNNQNFQNKTISDRIENLELLYLNMMSGDTVVNPPSSAWFYFYDSKMKQVIPIEDQPVYDQNLLGLKTLDQQGGLKFLSLPGNHIQFTQQDLLKYYIPALKGEDVPHQTIVDQEEYEEYNGAEPVFYDLYA